MDNKKIFELIKKSKENDMKAVFELIMIFEDLINKESLVNGRFNQECKDYVIDNLLKQIKNFKKF